MIFGKASIIFFFHIIGLLFFTNKVDSSSKSIEVETSASNQIKTNDFNDNWNDEKFAKLRASLSHAMTNGSESDLDHNALVAHYNNVLHSPIKRNRNHQKPLLLASSTITSKLVDYISRSTLAYNGYQNMFTEEKEPVIASTSTPDSSINPSNESVSPTLSQPLADLFSDPTMSYAFNFSTTYENLLENFTLGQDETTNQLLMQQLMLYNNTR